MSRLPQHSLWSATDALPTAIHSKQILESGSPYQGMLAKATLPSEAELIERSAILHVRPDLKSKSFAGQIAAEEYAHYLAQTYYFEVLGFQIIGDLASYATSLAYVHDLAAQAMDEVRHMQIYLALRNQLPGVTPFAPAIPKIYETLIGASSFPEKVIKGLVVLESLALGLFAGRLSTYPNASTRAIDKQTLKEESNHLHHDVAIVELMMQNGQLSYSEIIDLVREGVKQISLDILPTPVAERFGDGMDEKEIAQLKRSGLMAAQGEATRSSLKQSLTCFHRCAERYGRNQG